MTAFLLTRCSFMRRYLTENEVSITEKQKKNYSHREKGYRSTKNGEIIPYTYAKYLDLE